MDYGLTNIEEKKNKVLELAINKAKEKAAFLAKASGVELGEIHSLEYHAHDIVLCAARFNRAEEQTLDLRPEPEEISESVDISWEIK